MTRAAVEVMIAFPEIVLAYGQSDEYSFVFDKSARVFNRRESKLLSTVVSTFTAAFATIWNGSDLGRGDDIGRTTEGIVEPRGTLLPTFDGRLVLYPNNKCVRDYFAWRQADCHINNLFNTTFWALVKKQRKVVEETMENAESLPPIVSRIKRQVHERIKDTNSAGKNEILFTECGINYNAEPALFKKGTILHRASSASLCEAPDFGETSFAMDGPSVIRAHSIVVLHDDLISEKFWDRISHLSPGSSSPRGT